MSAEANPFEKLAQEKLENEIEQLRSENATLVKHKLLNTQNEFEGQEYNDKLRAAAQEKLRKAKGLLLKFIMRSNSQIGTLKAFY